MQRLLAELRISESYLNILNVAFRWGTAVLSGAIFYSSQPSCAALPLLEMPKPSSVKAVKAVKAMKAMKALKAAKAAKAVKAVQFTLGEAPKGRLRDDFLNVAFTLGKAQKGRGGMTLSTSCNLT